MHFNLLQTFTSNTLLSSWQERPCRDESLNSEKKLLTGKYSGMFKAAGRREFRSALSVM